MLPNMLSAMLASLPQHLLSEAELPLNPRPVEHGKSATVGGNREEMTQKGGTLASMRSRLVTGASRESGGV